MSAAVDSSYSSIAGRPIRPLPKRRLRERLSEDASARFSPPQPPSAPLFIFPFNSYASDSTFGRPGSPGYGDVHGMADGLQDSSDDEDNSNASVTRGVEGAASGLAGGTGNGDPYEWTENTNNKKKRKIPTHTNPGGSSGSGGIGSSSYGSSTSPGFSPTSSSPRNRWKPGGSGSSQRSPLSAMSSANHARRTQRRYPVSPSSESFAPAANSSKPRDDPVTPSKSRPKTPPEMSSGVPKQTQFTFVCESPVSANLSYTTHAPSTGSSGAESSSPTKSVQTVGTQTSPKMSDYDASYQATPARTKKSKKLSRRELFAREQRRRRQELLAGHHNNGEIWICEFCEYESIFGTPPLALMQQYEIKDRKERRRLAEKRRLLEKAKQKGKKSSKGGSKKNSGGSGAVTTTTTTTTGHAHPPPPPPPPPSSDSSHGPQGGGGGDGAAVIPGKSPNRRHSAQVQTDDCSDHHHHHPPSCGRGANGPCCVHGGGDGQAHIHPPA